MKRVLTVTNQKGGVGKTTLVFHLAHLAAEQGLQVLVVDFDTQGNATSALTGSPPPVLAPDEGAGALFFRTDSLEPMGTPHEGIKVLAGHQRLEGLDDITIQQAFALRDQVRALPYDLVLFDTPPAVGVRNLAPLLYADKVVIPIEPNSFAAQGLNHTLQNVALALQLNESLSTAIVINRLNAASKKQLGYIKSLTSIASLQQPYLTNRIAVSAAIDEGKPVWRLREAPRDLRILWRSACEALLWPGGTS